MIIEAQAKKFVIMLQIGFSHLCCALNSYLLYFNCKKPKFGNWGHMRAISLNFGQTLTILLASDMKNIFTDSYVTRAKGPDNQIY